jgi:hypothetical protein
MIEPMRPFMGLGSSSVSTNVCSALSLQKLALRELLESALGDFYEAPGATDLKVSKSYFRSTPKERTCP